jgi:methanogenic corrinoid protein MtbC1
MLSDSRDQRDPALASRFCVGVPETSLRAWERRYGLLALRRSAGGFRIYSEEDAERVAAMLRGLEQRRSAAEAAGSALDGAPVSAGSASGDGLAIARERLVDAVRSYDEAAVHAVLDEVLAAFGLEPLLTGLLLPTLAAIGSRWEQGELDISQEHFASNPIRARLLALARLWGRGGGPLALLACLPGERHDISLIAFGVLLGTYGWRIVFLGVDTPIETVRHAITATGPTVTVLAAFTGERLESAGAAPRRLARKFPVVVTGPEATEEVARRFCLRRLDGDVVEAARRLAEGPPDIAA